MADRIKLEVAAYYSDNSRRIHLLFDDFRATVSNEQGRANYHPELFRKLADQLRAAGVSVPEGSPNV